MALRGYKAKWGRRSYLGPLARVERDIAEVLKKEFPRLPIRRRRPERARREREYNRRLPDWLARPENQVCRVWLLSDEFKRLMFDRGNRRAMRASQCHHKYGRKLTRKGDLLLAEQWWVPVSAEGHDWIDRNKQRARELGLLAPLGQYNTWPETKI